MSYETLLYEQAGHVVTLTYNRPAQHNAVNRAMNVELHHAWERFRDDDEAFVLVITGAGETTFCAGWDLADAANLSEIGDYDAFRVSLHNSPGECGYTRKADIFKPVIAAVNGYAFAAGLETALLADIRIAAENAEFGALERRWNIVGGDGMTVRLPLVVGFAKAMELVITGRRIDVREAQRIGLVNEVVPRGAALGRAQQLAHEIAALPQGAIRSDKESIMRGVGRTLERRWNIVGGDGMTVRLPLVVGFAKAMELVITGRRIGAEEAQRIGLVNEIVPRGAALVRAQELAHEIAALPQGAIRSDKESIMRGVGRTLEERLRIEAEMVLSMFMRRDSHTLGAAAFKAGDLTPEWPHHGL